MKGWKGEEGGIVSSSPCSEAPNPSLALSPRWDLRYVMALDFEPAAKAGRDMHAS